MKSFEREWPRFNTEYGGLLVGLLADAVVVFACWSGVLRDDQHGIAGLMYVPRDLVDEDWLLVLFRSAMGHRF